MTGNVFELTDLGFKELKGIHKPTRAFLAAGEQQLESRFAARLSRQLSHFAGRQHELALVQERWHRACQSEGQVVLLLGEAGIGKSRMARELISSLAGDAYTRITYQWSPYHADSVFYPVVQKLIQGAQINNNDDVDTRLCKIENLLEELATPESVALIANLLNVDTQEKLPDLELSPAEIKVRTFDLLFRMLFSLSDSQPVLFVLEYLHWIDPTTLNLVNQVISQLAHRQILLLISSRPVSREQLSASPLVTRLTLGRISREQAFTMITDITRGKTLPDEVFEEILTRTDGIPLFIEELCKSLLESGELKENDTSYELTGTLDNLTISATLQDSLMARLDRLQSVNEVAQIAACIGREFSTGLLASVCKLNAEDLQYALDQLVEAELLYNRGTEQQQSYIFKHALLRDAAYEILLRSRRQSIHSDLAHRLLETSGSQPEIIAYHAIQAGLTDIALRYLQLAGQHATSRSAFTEAISHY